MAPEGSSSVEDARRAIRNASGVVILTGAGVSAESGIPTFRDPEGLWATYRPEELATPEAFRRDPRRVWEWYELRRRAVIECRPNPGHGAIAGLLLAREDATLVTQNVDGLHQRALAQRLEEADGSPAPRGPGSDGRPEDSRILELHGNLLRTRCSRCGTQANTGEELPKPVDSSSDDALPRCAECGGLLRPDVVWFGEQLDSDVLERAFQLARDAEVCVVAGTSAVVHPAAGIPLATLESGGAIIEVNPEATPITALSRWILREPAGTGLPSIL